MSIENNDDDDGYWEVGIFFLHVLDEEADSERQSDLPEVTQLVSGRARIQTMICVNLKPTLLLYPALGQVPGIHGKADSKVK